MMKKVFLMLGSNLGDKNQHINNAKTEIEKRSGSIVQASSIYKTEPWGFEHPEYFLNQAIIVQTSLTPYELLREIGNIESTLGRKHTQNGYEARIIDIDILLYNRLVLHDENLTIPHPLIRERRFVLAPLAEIAGEILHPVFKKTITRLLAECKDNSKVIRMD